jgi:hypothetical protein
MPKKYDLAVCTGTYQTNEGEKKRWKNVGVVMSNDNGHYILMDKTFNPAGLAEPGKESIIISMFEPKQQPQQGQPQQQPASNVNLNQDFDDDLPPF